MFHVLYRDLNHIFYLRSSLIFTLMRILFSHPSVLPPKTWQWHFSPLLESAQGCRVYLPAVASDHKTEFPFILLISPHGGHPFSRFTITWWIWQLLTTTYFLQPMPLRKGFPPFPIRVPSTSAVGFSSSNIYIPDLQGCHLVLCSNVFQVILGLCSGFRMPRAQPSRWRAKINNTAFFSASHSITMQ